ncbi:MAG: associated Golgi protein-like protein [Clostridiaceae bacterium]|uniref:TVP38/TMEM64 family protein n=1 Tax=Sedimentibacter sp. B4 TaxID=304766 RepID=UPI0002DD0969|nr:TVP38/TMEM64 family protein [Sedimentibacter sp. B4]MDF2881880.1 associated Golgi protein-like protein [Clostridiaceae bacterium]
MKKRIFMLLTFIIIIILIKQYNIYYFFSFENISELKLYIKSFGIMAPCVFILMFALATVLFVPGLPITVLSGILFGAFWGTVYVVIGSTIGVSLAFFIGRYIGREFVKKMAGKNERMSRLDNYIKEQGNTILIISRLVPLFPFNLQNYVYGITDIKFGTYFWYSLIFMVPGTFIYTCFGALAYSSMTMDKIIIYSSFLLIGLCTLIILPKKFFNLKAEMVNNNK